MVTENKDDYALHNHPSSGSPSICIIYDAGYKSYDAGDDDDEEDGYGDVDLTGPMIMMMIIRIMNMIIIRMMTTLTSLDPRGRDPLGVLVQPSDGSHLCHRHHHHRHPHHCRHHHHHRRHHHDHHHHHHHRVYHHKVAKMMVGEVI